MGADTAQRDRSLRAAFGLAVALYVVSLLPAPVPEAACARPRELRAERGHTSAVACAKDGAGGALRGPARRLYGLPIDPNRADARTLETLPGIGAVRAAAILRAREQRPFATLEELLRVPGIGPVTLARLAPLLAIPRAVAAENR